MKKYFIRQVVESDEKSYSIMEGKRVVLFRLSKYDAIRILRKLELHQELDKWQRKNQLRICGQKR